jgi:hypothetical protein
LDLLSQTPTHLQSCPQRIYAQNQSKKKLLHVEL